MQSAHAQRHLRRLWAGRHVSGLMGGPGWASCSLGLPAYDLAQVLRPEGPLARLQLPLGFRQLRAQPLHVQPRPRRPAPARVLVQPASLSGGTAALCSPQQRLEAPTQRPPRQRQAPAAQPSGRRHVCRSCDTRDADQSLAPPSPGFGCHGEGQAV